MRRVPVESLKPTNRLRHPLYDTGGECLHDRGEAISETNLLLLRASGVKEVVELEPQDDLKRFQFEAAFTSVPIEGVSTDEPLPHAIHDTEGRLLLKAGHFLSAARRDQLALRGVVSLYIPRDSKEQDASRVQAYRDAAEICAAHESDIALPESLIIASPDEIRPERLDAWKSSALGKGRTDGDGNGAAQVQEWPTGHERPAPRVIAYARTFAETMQGLKDLTTDLTEGRGGDGANVASISSRVIRSVLKDSHLAANVLHFRGDGEYLVAHSTRVSFLAVTIGTVLGYREEELAELAYGAFLMDIGMTRVPPAIVQKPGRLTDEERAEVERHPVLGLGLLERITSLPRTAALVAYQSHERSDGSGYPRGSTDANIHEYAKIVSIADIFDALTWDRPYRPGVLPYKAMEEVLQQAGKRKFAPGLVRAFLSAVSLFPIGSWVELTDGSICRVVSAHRNDYHRPVVRVWREGAGLGGWIDLRARANVKVARAIPPPQGANTLFVGF